MTIKYTFHQNKDGKQKFLTEDADLETTMSAVQTLTTHVCSMSEQPLNTIDTYTVTETGTNEAALTVTIDRGKNGSLKTVVTYEPMFVERIEERHRKWHENEEDDLAKQIMQMLVEVADELNGPGTKTTPNPFHYN